MVKHGIWMTQARYWTAYNATQSGEKSWFVALLSDLYQTAPQPEQHGKGRLRLLLSDMVFASAFKVYVGFSARRFTCDLKEVQADGLIDKAAHFNSINRYLSDPRLAEVLKAPITTSSLPVKAVETDFAVDSSGFSTKCLVRCSNWKYRRQEENRERVKARLMCGVNTKIVTAADVSGRPATPPTSSRWSREPPSVSRWGKWPRTKPA